VILEGFSTLLLYASHAPILLFTVALSALIYIENCFHFLTGPLIETLMSRIFSSGQH